MKINFIKNGDVYTFPNDKPPHCNFEIKDKNIIINKMIIKDVDVDSYIDVFCETENVFSSNKELIVEKLNNKNKYKFSFKVGFCGLLDFEGDNNIIEELIKIFESFLEIKEVLLLNEDCPNYDPFA